MANRRDFGSSIYKSSIYKYGQPDVIDKVGSTRYKYAFAVWIEHIRDLDACRRKWGREHYGDDVEEGTYRAYQAGPPGRPAVLLGIARSLAEAERIAEERAERF